MTDGAHYSTAHFDHAALDRDRVLPRLVARRAQEDGDRIFARMVGGPSITYRQAHEEALRWATALDGLGVGAQQTVAVMAPIRLEAITTWVGLAWLKAWEVPINTDYRGRMLSHILASSHTETFIVDARWLDRLAEIADDVPGLRRVIVTGSDEAALPDLGFEMIRAEDLLASVTELGAFEGPEPTDVAAILYTSGTTGPSKGVIAPWAHMLATFQQPQWEHFGPEDHRYSPFPMYHMSGKGSVYGAALCGANIVLKEKWSGTDFWDDIARYRCTFTWLVGGMPALLYGQPETPHDADTPLKYALMAPVLPQYRDFERRFGVKLATAFGMTELSMPVVTDWDIPNHRTCGRPRPGYQVRVVDEHDIPVGPGEFGEFVVRSNTPWTVNIGYLGMPEQTAQAWRHGWFHTGDGGHYDTDGNFYFGDRIKDAIRRRGENISSLEVEADVLTHPEVAECAAIGVPDPLGEEEVMVFVVAAGDLDPAALGAYLAERMTRFMLPRYIQLVPEIPRTPTSRIRKVELRKLVDLETAWDRVTQGAGVESARG
ncbi:MAG TPA: AMP-binding protein [Pseudonocardia sp.]|nr:AMP-binding protein [Pseudonocardia sp.]